MRTITIVAGKRHEKSLSITSIENTLKFYFVLTHDWSQLYELSDNSTHKICGVKGLFGRNSLRLGVRRAPNKTDGLVAVPYLHVKGKIEYGAFLSATNKPVILHFDSVYFCSLEKVKDGWSCTICNAQHQVICSAIKPVRIPLIGRHLSSTYIEVGDQPSPWTIKTLLGIERN
jgi:hypothetical protein